MELTIDKIKINDLEYQNKLLKERLDDLNNKERLDDFKKSIDFFKKESDTIKKLSKESEEAKIKRLNIIHDTNRSNTIDDIIKSYDDLCTPTKIPQSVRKRDDKARTLVPKDFKKDSLPKYNKKSNRLKNLKKKYQNTTEEKNIEKDGFIDPTTLKKITKNSGFYEYEINLSYSRIKYLDKIIEENPEMSAKKIDIINQLKTLYTFKKIILEDKINDPKSKKADLRAIDDDICNLEDEFRNQKGSGTFTYQNKFVKLLTLLTQLLTKNKNQILKELNNSKQITKQVYNLLNKSIPYKNY